MYKEIISRKKIPLIVIALLLVTIMLYIHEMISVIGDYDVNKIHMFNIILLTVTILLIAIELRLSIISYKYSLIAGKLIINKIVGSNEKNLVSLKVNNILYIGDRTNIPQEYKDVTIKRSFCCSFLRKNRSICIFKQDEDVQAFYFSPSKCLKNKIELCK